MMLPVIIGRADSLPSFVEHYRSVFEELSMMADVVDGRNLGQVGYLTIDEKVVAAGKTHRRAGMHVDGGKDRGWGGGGGWAGKTTGMLTVSSLAGCRAWRQRFRGEVGEEGGCEHLAGELKSVGVVLLANEVYWLDGMCVHESLPQEKEVARQFVRLSLPSTAFWYEGYTRNPLGVLPTGEILPRRSFMEEEVGDGASGASGASGAEDDTGTGVEEKEMAAVVL